MHLQVPGVSGRQSPPPNAASVALRPYARIRSLNPSSSRIRMRCPPCSTVDGPGNQAYFLRSEPGSAWRRDS